MNKAETPGWADAGLSAYWTWRAFRSARNPVDAADALIQLANAMSDFASWLPGYDERTGEITEEETL